MRGTTNITKKEQLWPKFVKACESQWKGGGKRYALNGEMEFTDLVTMVAGNEWILGNIVKYVGEILNAMKSGEPIQEVDFFKISVYSFLLWIKEQDNLTSQDKGEEFEK